MEKLLEQAQALVVELRTKIRHYNDREAILTKEQAANDSIKATLDNFQVELLEREAKITPIENIQEAKEKTAELKANAELEWSKIRAEWDAIKTRKQSDQAEAMAVRNKNEQDKELYERGAKENAITKAKLDEKLDKLKQAGV